MVKSNSTPSFIHDLLAHPPQAGEGVHGYLFRVALKLHPYWTDDEIYAWLREFGNTCGRFVPDREITDAIDDSRPFAWQGYGQKPASAATGNGMSPPHAPAPPWPVPDQDLIEQICRQGPCLSTLREASPVKFDDGLPHAEEIIDAVLPGDPWLCCGLSTYSFSTKRRSEWQGSLSDQALIVPSAMIGRFGFTKNDEVSEHAQSAVGPRQFLVIEFDFSEKSRDGTRDTALAPLIRKLAAAGITVADMCAALLAHLSRFAPLAFVVHSGGKSLHGWFPCVGVSEGELRDFMHYACELGADSKTWTASQFVRMPDGTRYDHRGQNPRRQQVCFFDPKALPYV